MGWVAVDPLLLAGPRPAFGPPLSDETPRSGAARPDHPLIAWLERQRSGGTARDEAETVAKRLARALAERYRLARTFGGVPAGLPVGPSPAQWASVYEAARTATDATALRRDLFEGTDAICKPRAENWTDQFRDEAGLRSFHDWFRDAAADAAATVAALRLFGREAQRIAQREYGRGGREEGTT